MEKELVYDIECAGCARLLTFEGHCEGKPQGVACIRFKERERDGGVKSEQELD